ncbi:thrombomodulin-like [Myripristis murdjan]|uniref:thrombomodulin-like n=1 Tax=Myripristis murdjan TaxID=586833 RepID=UPI0011763DDB|nr:thrombomodulin-like [Myripristis murdjan]
MGVLLFKSVFLSVKIISFFSLLALIVLIPVNVGVGVERPTGACRPLCVGDECVTVHQDKVDFNTAEEACQNRNGELLAFQSEAVESSVEMLAEGVFGNLWIGLRLPVGICSNLSAPLRGYEWTSGSKHKNKIPPFSSWKDSVKRCSPQCVSLSGDLKWTERPCLDKIDGFLCKTKHKDACRGQELSDTNVFLSPEGCSDAPCEHTCTDVKGGYKCTCFNGYAPSRQDPHRCQMHCPNKTCPAICDRNTGGQCSCPEGFLKSENLCEDIDECEMKHCEQDCENSYGSFLCSCREGFTLKDEVKCVSGDGDEALSAATPIITGDQTRAVNTTLKISTATAGSFVWPWIVFALAVLVVMLVVRYCVVKRRERSEPISQQRSAADVDC